MAANREDPRIRVLGLLADPDLPAELAEELAGELPRLLQEHLGDRVAWEVRVTIESQPDSTSGPASASSRWARPTHPLATERSPWRMWSRAREMATRAADTLSPASRYSRNALRRASTVIAASRSHQQA